MSRNILLAKSIKPEDFNDNSDYWELRLPGHLEQGILAAIALKTISHEITQALGLQMPDQALIETVKLAIWLHDWGKCNVEFLGVVETNTARKICQSLQLDPPLATVKKQGVRHEFLSVILVLSKEVNQWLNPLKGYLRFAYLGILSHHLKNNSSSFFLPELIHPLEVLTKSTDFKRVLELGVNYFNLSSQYPKIPTSYPPETLREQGQNLRTWVTKVQNETQGDFDALKAIATVKALTMSCDLAASALLENQRGKRNYHQWIDEALNQRLTVEDCQAVIDSKLNGKTLRLFQEKAKTLTHRVVLVVAGCGTGKSLIPYIRHQQFSQELKLFFTFPTTVTTTQGFIDYAANKIENSLLSHSRDWVDRELRGFSQMCDDDEGDETEKFITKAEALRLWHSKLIYCTAHTVLGLLQNYRKGLYGFPALALGHFVFDEIHSYPDELFGNLLQFLRIFRNSPITLMTASLPPAKLAAIQQILADQGEELEQIEGDKTLEQVKRYRLIRVGGNQENQEIWQRIRTELKQGGKVLWVTNQVADCQTIYLKAVKEIGDLVKPICFHSRFRYQDLVKRHEELVDSFRDSNPAFAVTTQVAEMSLDINSTLLITAMAPIWSLIQRLGRLNRWEPLTSVRDCWVYAWEKDRPYRKTELLTGERLLKLFENQEISQEDLAQAIANIQDQAPNIKDSTWLNPALSIQGDLMPPAYTLPVILEEDISAIFEQAKKLKISPKQEVKKWIVPVIINYKTTKTWEYHKTFKYFRVAPSSEVQYSLETGAMQQF